MREVENGITGELGEEIENAQTTANDAYNEEGIALGQIVDMGADGKLTPVGKVVNQADMEFYCSGIQ